MSDDARNPEDITVVHLMRHGEVHNPDGVLYGRRAGYHLSEPVSYTHLTLPTN